MNSFNLMVVPFLLIVMTSVGSLTPQVNLEPIPMVTTKLPALLRRQPTRHPERVDSAPYERLRQFSRVEEGRLFKTKYWNMSLQYVIPLFTFSFPPTQAQGTTIELVNQAMYALFTLFIITCMYAWPILVTDPLNDLAQDGGGGRSMSVKTVMESTAGNFHWLIDKRLANEIGLNQNNCLQKTICQVHQSPKYGFLYSIFSIFFPPPEKEELYGIDKQDCAQHYKCFFDILDLTHYFFDWWQLSNQTNTKSCGAQF